MLYPILYGDHPSRESSLQPVKRWTDDIMLMGGDPFGVEDFATHRLPHGYDIFQKKQDGAVKVLLKP